MSCECPACGRMLMLKVPPNCHGLGYPIKLTVNTSPRGIFPESSCPICGVRLSLVIPPNCHSPGYPIGFIASYNYDFRLRNQADVGNHKHNMSRS